MNTLFATSASPVRRMVLAILLALILVPLMLTGAATGTAHAASCTRIASVGAFNSNAHQTVYMSGTCLGSHNGYNGQDTYYFQLYVTPHSGGRTPWAACYAGDTVTCSVYYWQNNEIAFKGFSGQFGQGDFTLAIGDSIRIWIWDTQTRDTSICNVTVGYGNIDC